MSALFLVSPEPIAARARPSRDQLYSLIPDACSHLKSKHSRAMYSSVLMRFLDSNVSISREGIRLYISRLHRANKSAATVNQTVAVLRAFLRECKHQRVLDRAKVLSAMHALPKKESGGIRLGNWLTEDGARALIASPDASTLEGLRDSAVIALLLGCGLRREEACALTWDSYRAVNGRMCLVDFTGKGNKSRTVPVPTWAVSKLDTLRTNTARAREDSASPISPFILQRLSRGKGTQSLSGQLSPQGVWFILRKHARKLGIQLTPHDLRRTVAQLMRKNGATIEQIQYTLGHADSKTTQLYLGGRIELTPGRAAIDKVDLS